MTVPQPSSKPPGVLGESRWAVRRGWLVRIQPGDAHDQVAGGRGWDHIAVDQHARGGRWLQAIPAVDAGRGQVFEAHGQDRAGAFGRQVLEEVAFVDERAVALAIALEYALTKTTPAAP